tara:strand:- start:188 stop:385 length:198 start_codon:yes stop_codon:yes gene_type:complete
LNNKFKVIQTIVNNSHIPFREINPKLIKKVIKRQKAILKHKKIKYLSWLEFTDNYQNSSKIIEGV